MKTKNVKKVLELDAGHNRDTDFLHQIVSI
jgi:hypothetical protein